MLIILELVGFLAYLRKQKSDDQTPTFKKGQDTHRTKTNTGK